MNQILKARCDTLNVDYHSFNKCSGAHILVYVDIPDVEEHVNKELIISQILLKSVKDEFEETYPDLELEYFHYYNKIEICIYPTLVGVELCLDLTEHIINIIDTIHDDNSLTDDMVELNYYRSVIITQNH